MTDTTFVDRSLATPIVASWLNDVNKLTYKGFPGYVTSGIAVSYADTGVLAGLASSVAGYNQVVLQNTSSAANASANFNVSNDAGTATTNFGEFGINSSGFTGAGAFNQPGMVYLAAGSGELTMGTYAAKAFHLVVGGSATDSVTGNTDGTVTIPSLRFQSLGTGSVVRTATAKMQERVSPLDFGAVGDGVTDDTAAVNRAWSYGARITDLCGKYYRVTASLNFTGVADGRGLQGPGGFVGDGATIGNYPIIDISGSNQVQFRDFDVRSYAATTCFIGILAARVGSNSSGNHNLTNINAYGSFSNSAMYTSSSEEDSYINCQFETLTSGARAASCVDTPEVGVTSLYQNILSPTGGNTVIRFFGCRMNNLTSNASNRSLFVKSSRAFGLHSCYMNAGPASTCTIEATATSGLVLDNVTAEGTPTNVILMNGSCIATEISGSVLGGGTNGTVKGAVGSTVTALNIRSTTPSSYLFDGPTLANSNLDCENIAAVRVTTSSVGNFFRNQYNSASLSLTGSVGDMYTIGQPGVTPNVGFVSNGFVLQPSWTTGTMNDIARNEANIIQVVATTGALVLTGFTAGRLGQTIKLIIPLTYQVTIANNTGSAAGNVIYTTTNANVVIAAAANNVKTIMFTYLGTGWQMEG